MNIIEYIVFLVGCTIIGFAVGVLISKTVIKITKR